MTTDGTIGRGGGGGHRGGVATHGGAWHAGGGHAAPAHHGPPSHHGGHGHGGRRRFFRAGRWWWWDGSAWLEEGDAIVCQEWSAPLDLAESRELLAYAVEALAGSDGEPVAERLADGWLYLFTRGPVVRRCWLDQGGAIGSVVPHPEARRQASGTIGDGPAMVVRPHPKGMAGVRKGVKEIAARMVRSARSRPFIEWTRQVVKSSGAAEPRGYPEPDRIVAAVFAAWKREVAFVQDPVNTELMIGAVQLLCLDPAEGCFPAGDCDDQLIGMGAALLALGIPVWIRLRRYAGQAQAHVTLLYDSNPRKGGPAKCLDPSIEDGVCSDAPYLEEIITEPNMGEDAPEGVFIGIGAPVDGIGAPPLDAGTSDAIAGEAEALARAVAALQTAAAEHAAARAALGQSEVDSFRHVQRAPLAEYLHDSLWTRAARDAEASAIASASVLGAALADALAGGRAVAPSGDGDLLIAAREGDTFGVIAVQGSSGELGAWYVDTSTGAPAGMPGAAPLGGAGVVTSLWAVVVVRELLAALGEAHAQDAARLRAALAARRGDGTIGVAGIVTPADILAYRAAWEPYVRDTVESGWACAANYRNAAATMTDPAKAATLNTIAQDEQTRADDIQELWNKWSTLSPASLVLQGATVLESFQSTVLTAGQSRESMTASGCPLSYYDRTTGELVQAAPAADPSLQAQVIAQIEGTGLLVQGLLQILGQSVQGGLQALGSAAQWAGQQAGKIIDTATSPWLWLTIAIVGVAAVFYFAPRALGAAAALRGTSGASAPRRRSLRAPRRRRRLADWPNNAEGHRIAAYRGWDHRRERQERVTTNLPPEYLPLWNRIGGRFSRGTPHERFEAFMRYVEEHPHEVIEAIESEEPDYEAMRAWNHADAYKHTRGGSPAEAARLHQASKDAIARLNAYELQAMLAAGLPY